MNTSRIRAKKLLITAGFYSTQSTREAESLLNQGYSLKQIDEKMGLSNAGVNALLPYKRGAYFLNDPTLNAINNRLLRKRKRACTNLANLYRQTTCVIKFQIEPAV